MLWRSRLAVSLAPQGIWLGLRLSCRPARCTTCLTLHSVETRILAAAPFLDFSAALFISINVILHNHFILSVPLMVIYPQELNLRCLHVRQYTKLVRDDKAPNRTYQKWPGL